MLINENEIIRNFPQKIASVKKHILGQEVTSVGQNYMFSESFQLRKNHGQ